MLDETSILCGGRAGGFGHGRVGFRAAGASSDDETPSIKKVMTKLHKGKTSPLNTSKAALKSDSPDWTKVQKEAKVYRDLSAAMPKNDPRAATRIVRIARQGVCIGWQVPRRIRRERRIEGISRRTQEDLELVHAVPQKPSAKLTVAIPRHRSRCNCP